MEKIKYPTTRAMLSANQRLIQLQVSLPTILQNPFLWRHQTSIEDKTKYISILAEAKNTLWQIVYDKYPSLQGKSLQFNEEGIEVI